MNKAEKYSWQKVDENKFYVWHIEGDTKTQIAITDTAEKAHFLSKAANNLHASSLQPSPVDEEGIKAMVEMYKAAASSIPSNGEWISVEKDADYDGEYYGYIKRTEECGAVNEIQRVVVNRYNKWILEANEELLYYMPLFAKPIK